MKKLLIIITLFVSSFFLFSIEDAKAYEYSIDLDFSFLNDDSLAFKEEVEDFISSNTEYSSNYVVYRNFTTKSYNAILFKDFDINIISYYTNSSKIQVNTTSPIYWYKNATSISSVTSFTLYHNNVAYPYPFSQILYINFDFPIDSSMVLNYKYEDFTFVDSASTTNKVTSLEDLYIEYQKFTGDYVEPEPEPEPEPEENPHQEEIDKLTNFYTMIIEKIEYLAEEISNNYILLFTIGIFIITFVFLLIFRRFL